MTGILEPLRRIGEGISQRFAIGWIDGLVHASVSDDAAAAARHRAFLALHLGAGLLALAALPVALALSGRPGLPLAVLLGWLATPLFVAAFLARTGRLDAAFLLSALSQTGLVAGVAACTGATASPALAWLAVIPIAAAFSNARRIVILAAGLAVGALAVLAALQLAGGLPEAAMSPVLAPIVAAGAVVAAAMGGLRLQAIAAAAAREAARSEALYRLVAENTADLVTCLDARGSVRFASPTARAVLGCAASELREGGLFERILVADRPLFLHAMSEIAHHGTPRTLEFRLRRDDGDEPHFILAETRARAVSDPLTGERSIVAVTRDVTAREAHLAELAAAREAAEASSRLKGQFLANMSHELRTPLNAIIGFSDILLRDLFGSLPHERHRDYARLIHSSGEHLLQVVNSVLDLSKIEAGRLDLQLAPLPIAGLLDSALEMLSCEIADRNLNLIRTIDRGLPDLVGDRRACKQVLLNLLSNAVKFTEPGGRISIGAHLAGDRIRIEISDTGIGIAADDLPRLGTPFVQADSGYDRRFEGTGLGLSVVKGLLDVQGGRLEIRSELGKGTTAIVDLPAERPMPANDPVYLGRERKIA